mmetsp:Transcript_60610/g.120074  ORF Transcript_60610/g.120074 Transcript_60610/m.120074 type:complete len:95 (-) Transcript_60610:8-292(-)
MATSLGSPHVPDRRRGLRAELSLEVIGKVTVADEEHRPQGTKCKKETSGSKVHARGHAIRAGSKHLLLMDAEHRANWPLALEKATFVTRRRLVV